MCAFAVAGLQMCAEAIDGVVGDRQRFRLVAVGQDRRYWPEDLLARDAPVSVQHLPDAFGDLLDKRHLAALGTCLTAQPLAKRTPPRMPGRSRC